MGFTTSRTLKLVLSQRKVSLLLILIWLVDVKFAQPFVALKDFFKELMTTLARSNPAIT